MNAEALEQLLKIKPQEAPDVTAESYDFPITIGTGDAATGGHANKGRLGDPNRDFRAQLRHRREYGSLKYADAKAYWLYDSTGAARNFLTAEDDLKLHYAHGLYPACPFCFGFHIKSETDFNACPKRLLVYVMFCRVCGKKMYDTEALKDRDTLLRPEHPELEYVIKPYIRASDYASDVASAMGRMMVMEKNHVQAFHPQSAAVLFPVEPETAQDATDRTTDSSTDQPLTVTEHIQLT